MCNEHERFYKTVPMVGTIPENSRGGGGTGLQPVVCGKVAAAGTDRIGGAGVVVHSVVVDAQSDALREALERIAVGMMPPETIEGWRNLAMERVDIARAALDALGFEIREKNDV